MPDLHCRLNDQLRAAHAPDGGYLRWLAPTLPAQLVDMVAGITSGNGWAGDPVSADRAQVIIEAFRQPYHFQQVHGRLHD